MDKPTFLAVLASIVAEFESPAFQEAMVAAQASGDVSRIIQVPLDAQNRALMAHNVDVATGAAQFKAAGQRYGADADVAPLLARMKKALGK